MAKCELDSHAKYNFSILLFVVIAVIEIHMMLRFMIFSAVTDGQTAEV